MRSRNGNRPFIFPSLALICTLSFGAEHYYIGYRLTTKDTQPIEEILTLSKAMQPCRGENKSALLLRRHITNEPLETILERDRTAFLEYAGLKEFRLKSNLTMNESRISTLQTLTLPTQCYAVEFNDDSVTISQLQ